MALKSIKHLTPRSQGKLIGQVYKLICLYNDFFCPRSRIYLKDVLRQDGVLYWAENPKTQDLATIALVEPKYRFTVSDINLVTIGHTISKINNQMQPIFDHILGDHADKSVMLLARTTVGLGIQSQFYGFVPFSPMDLEKLWPELATMSTDYFNLGNKESFAQGLGRKQYLAFFKFREQDLERLEKTHPEMVKAYHKAQAEAV